MSATALLLLLGFGLAAAEFSYLCLAIWAVIGFRPRPAGSPTHRPPVTLMVPAYGATPQLEWCLRSIVHQDYPTYQVVFGLHATTDSARPLIERLIAAFPALDMSLVIDPRMVGANPKNCNLANMMPAVKHDVIVMVDSDVHVGPDFLDAIVGSLEAPSVGGVTCLYKGAPTGGLAARLGALAINDWFVPSVLLHLMLRDIDRCYGAVIAVTREALDRIGGIESMASAVAQDYVFGQELKHQGYGIALAPYVVETVVAEVDLASLVRHERRWTRSLRAYEPVDHALSIVTHALPVVALVLFLAAPTPVATLTVGVLAGTRIGLHFLLRARIGFRDRPAPWLVPVRECLTFVVWASTFLTRSVHWGQRELTVTGRLSMAARKELH